MTIKEALQTLDLKITPSKPDLKKAFRQAQLIWHPDRFEGNPELQKKASDKTYQINEAYELLAHKLGNQARPNFDDSGLKKEPEFSEPAKEDNPQPPTRSVASTNQKQHVMSVRSPAWKWFLCGLLLLATTINYMDRQTLSNAAVRVTKEFQLSQEQYGDLELAFGWAFAVGSLVFGFLADRFRIYWLYPIVLTGWSLMGIASAHTDGYWPLLTCRVLLGFFEAGHWPCALKTTFALLQPQDRMMGNSVLQSGASIGAVVTPPMMIWLMTDDITSWRFAFQVIGAIGLLWVVLWFVSVRKTELDVEIVDDPAQRESLWDILLGRKFWALAILIFGAQTCWHLFRVWLPKFMQEGRGYSETAALAFNSAYYIGTDIGCIAAGVISLWLARRFAISAHSARRWVYSGACVLTSFSVFVLWLPKGWPLMGAILVVGAGALALFPCYYSFVQELSDRHVGRLTGLLSTWVWAVSSPMHKLFGRVIDETKSFDLGMAAAGLAPWLGVIAMKLLWDTQKSHNTTTVAR